MKLKAILIDDESDARYLLRKSLLKHFHEEIEIAGEADSCKSALQLLRTISPDLVFLDIYMSDGTGFDILAELPDPGFQAVFVTAFDNLAIKAFEFSAVGYLVKPIHLADLRKAIERAQTNLERNRRNQSGLKVLIENYQAGQVRKIVVPHADGFSVLKLEDIIYLNSIRNYTEFNLAGSQPSKLLSSRTLILYEKLLSDYGFFRIHQTYLANLAHVQSYVRSEGSVLRMSNGDLLPVARQKKSELMERFL